MVVLKENKDIYIEYSTSTVFNYVVFNKEVMNE